MFTGIIEEVGRVLSFSAAGGKARLTVQAKRVLEDVKLGDSINIEGVCQTVTDFDSQAFSVDTLAESLKKTTLGALKAGSPVNLERAMRADTRMGGHIVQGHVACALRIQSLRREGGNVYLSVEVPHEHLRYCVPEGSIALDGISLTVSGISGNIVTANIIPATLEATSLGGKKTGDFMNLETDIIGRYVERLLAPYTGGGEGRLTFERMRELGF